MSFEKYKTAYGVDVKIFSVNPKTLASIKTRPKPPRPFIEMPIGKSGKTQSRPMKKGDEGWEDYQEELNLWEQEKEEIEEAVSLCLALRDVKYPDPIILPDYMQELISDGLMTEPRNKWELKAMWLRENVIGQHDEYEIAMIISKLNGLPEEIIAKQKERFRSLLLGEEPTSLGTGNDSRSGATEESD